MKLTAFDFDLPEDRIALRPADPRDSARMLRVTEDALEDLSIRDLPSLVRPGDVMVFNDTRVIPARLRGVRPADDTRGDANVELTLHLRKDAGTWQAFARPAKRLRVGDAIDIAVGFTATVIEKGEGGDVTLSFSKAAQALDLALIEHGEVPLPPYIAGKRATDDQDTDDYQTIYAEKDGAVAAPTAGLHFTSAL